MFGGNEEVQQTLQRIAGVSLLDEPKKLTEDGGSRHLERREKGGEGALNGRVQGLRILEDKEKNKNDLQLKSTKEAKRNKIFDSG